MFMLQMKLKLWKTPTPRCHPKTDVKRTDTTKSITLTNARAVFWK